MKKKELIEYIDERIKTIKESCYCDSLDFYFELVDREEFERDFDVIRGLIEELENFKKKVKS